MFYNIKLRSHPKTNVNDPASYLNYILKSPATSHP